MKETAHTILRYNCLKCRRFLFKGTQKSKIDLLIVPCVNCKNVNLYVLRRQTLYYKSEDVRTFKEPEGVIYQEKIDEIINTGGKIKLTG